MKRTLAIGLLALATGAAAQEGELTVSNEWYEVEIVRVNQVASLHGGMVVPEREEDAFLLVYLETADPCFDPARNAGCFDGERDEIDTLAWACGEVHLEDEAIEADGGGFLGGELACTFVVPRGIQDLTLVLRGYPEVDLRAGG